MNYKHYDYLKIMKGFKAKSPTVIRHVLIEWRWFVSLILFTSITMLVLIILGMPELAGGTFVGMTFVIAADIGRIMVRVKFWPIINQITDWDKVDELIEEHEADANNI